MGKLLFLIEYGFYLFIFLLPWQTRLIWQEASLNGFTWEYGRLSLYGTELLLWAILFLYGLWLLKTKRLQKMNLNLSLQKFKDVGALTYILIILLLLVAGISVIFSVKAKLSYYTFFKLIEVVTMMSMILVFNFKLQRIAIAWVSSSIVQSVFAIWQFFMQLVPANKWFGLAYHYSTVGGSIIVETAGERWLRAYGSLPHPNMLGGFLVIGLLFVLYLAFIAKKRSERYFAVSGLIVIIPAMFFSFSRSSWVALIVSLFLLGLWVMSHKQKTYRKMFFKKLFLIIFLISILATNLWQPLITRLQGKQPLEVNSIQLRYTFNEQAMEVFKDHPLTGAGIGSYTYGVYESVNGSWPGYYYQPVHNLYLLVLAELGIFGFIIFGLILLLLIFNLMRQPSSIEKVISFLILVCVLVISLFDHYFWTMFYGLMVLWIVIGLNLKNLHYTSLNSSSRK